MENWEVWNKILERGGVSLDNLSAQEKTIYRVNCFLSDAEGGGLSGFLYNISPTTDLNRWSALRETVAAVEAVGNSGCAAALRQPAELLERLPDGKASTWADYLRPVEQDLKTKFEPLIEGCINDLWAQLGDFTSQVLKGPESAQ